MDLEEKRNAKLLSLKEINRSIKSVDSKSGRLIISNVVVLVLCAVITVLLSVNQLKSKDRNMITGTLTAIGAVVSLVSIILLFVALLPKDEIKKRESLTNFKDVARCNDVTELDVLVSNHLNNENVLNETLMVKARNSKFKHKFFGIGSAFFLDAVIFTFLALIFVIGSMLGM